MGRPGVGCHEEKRERGQDGSLVFGLVMGLQRRNGLGVRHQIPGACSSPRRQLNTDANRGVRIGDSHMGTPEIFGQTGNFLKIILLVFTQF